MQTKHKGKAVSLPLTILLVAALVGSCRPPVNSGSGASDLGMLASGMTLSRQNFSNGGCGYQTSAVNGDVNAELERASGALPLTIRQYFRQWDVQFRLSSNITSECSQSLQRAANATGMRYQSQEMQRQLSACVLPRSNGATRGFDIVLNATPEAIHNWLLVESFALLYYLLDQAATPATRNNSEVSLDIAAIDQARESITSSFLSELSATNPGVVSRYESMFGRQGNLAQNSKFQSLVMAEFSDSYFCNQRTRAQNTMPRTRQLFDSFARQYLR